MRKGWEKGKERKGKERKGKKRKKGKKERKEGKKENMSKFGEIFDGLCVREVQQPIHPGGDLHSKKREGELEKPKIK